jgi:bacillithiol biosynthesis cysteine-adding enzyme BshC
MKVIEEIKLTETGLLPALVRDYILGKPELKSLYSYSPALSSFQQVIADKTKSIVDRQTLVGVLQAQYNHLNASQATSSNIQSLLSDNTFTVTAAHQPCLFMGPLYNIYKIAATVNLSIQLKKEYTAYHFVPVFWLGSEDHDVEELAHAVVNGKRIEWADAGSGACGRWNVASMQAAVEELKALVPGLEVVALLEEGLKRYQTFGQFSCWFVSELFKDYGLVVVDGDNPHLKKLFVNIIREEVFQQRATGVLQPTLDFLETNYKVQARPRDINFFYLKGNQRERILFDKEKQRFRINNTMASFSVSEMEKEIAEHPENFSPNVIYRPLYQEMVLPNLAFIGGAGELSYWLQLKPLFDYYRVNYPAVIMRNSAVILNASTQKKMQKLGLKVSDLFTDLEELVKEFVRKNSTADTSLEAEKQQLETLFDTIADKAALVDATLKQSAGTEKQKALNALATLEAKMLKAEKRNQEVAVNQIRAIYAHLFPQNSLQERVENFIPFYNSTYIAEMVELMNPLDGRFKVLLAG